MEKFEGYIFTALCSTNFLVSFLLFSWVTRELRAPYMDEIYHVPQAQRYCDGTFNEWDSNITTLPGLYVVSVGIIKLAGIIKPVVLPANLMDVVVCSTAMLRFINLLFNCGNLYLLYLLICKLHHREKTRTASHRVLSALSLSTFPVLYFFNFLYYTDPGSTFFILFAYLMTLYGCHKASASLGICAILFRQTNVVWVAFCAVTVAAARMDESWRAEHTKKRDEKPPPSQVPLSLGDWKRLLHFVLNFLAKPTQVKAVLLVAWPYAVVGAGFMVFVALNGSIVVGDRENHKAVLHFPQLFYFFFFALVFSLPVSLCYQRVLHFLQALRRQPLFFLLLSVASLLLVWKCTFVHHYLADNRHYIHYLLQAPNEWQVLVRVALVPAYIFAAWNFFDSMRSRSLFWSLGFLACLLAATVPEKLLEFRYFIVPYLMYRLHVPLPSLPRLALELLLYTVVNTATLYIFITITFEWPERSDLQRYMW